MQSVELFSGCGGLALGTARMGFQHLRMVEWNSDACATLRRNQRANAEHADQWQIIEGDVRGVRWRDVAESVELVAGGPPCQPFSIGGKHAGNSDRRDMWPEAIRAVNELRPQCFLFENVRGLARPAFAEYVKAIMTQLSRFENTHYNVRMIRLNAADYGAPQKRHRVAIIGVRDDVGQINDQIMPTHSRERLIYDKWVTKDYWKRHGISLSHQTEPSSAESRILSELRKCSSPPQTLPWVTIRDALKGLGEPNGINGHVFQPGAKVYKGHTGSVLDEPAKALKAGDHGVPGGENMMVKDDGTVRYFTIREAARLQGFPDTWLFSGAWSECMRQLGNAVPVPLAEALGLTVRQLLDKAKKLRAAA